MSHAEVELYIQPPMLETRVAVQMIAYCRLRKGLHKETEAVLAAMGINYFETFIEHAGCMCRSAAALRLLSVADRKTHANVRGMFQFIDHGDCIVLNGNIAVSARVDEQLIIP